jgi:hypothetical protein
MGETIGARWGTEKTKNLFIPIDVLGEARRERADEIILELAQMIPRYLGALSSQPSSPGKSLL